MRSINPYFNFDGNTREAMQYYAGILGAELEIQSFGDVGMAETPEMKDRTMHASLRKGDIVIMASDTMPGMEFVQGNNVWVNINCESDEEIERLFRSLSEGGTVIMPVADQFWGAKFGMLKDKYNIHWMFNYEKGN
jgi:PhnB protein